MTNDFLLTKSVYEDTVMSTEICCFFLRSK
jgi:hypothetical protein